MPFQKSSPVSPLVRYALAACLLGAAGDSAAIRDRSDQCVTPPAGPQLVAMVRDYEANPGQGDEMCLRHYVRESAPALWAPVVAMLRSDDQLARRTSLRLLSWRTESVSAKTDPTLAAALPALLGMLSDPGMRPYRARVKSTLLDYRERALSALPDFRNDAIRNHGGDEYRAVHDFLSLASYSPTQVDELLTVLDSADASVRTRQLVASRFSDYRIASCGRAVPSFKRLIDTSRDTNNGLLSALVGAYARCENSQNAATYLIGLRSANAVPGIGAAIDALADMHGMEQHLTGFLDDPALAVAAAATMQASYKNRRLPPETEREATNKLRTQLASPATLPMALASIVALERPIPGAAPVILAHYRTLPQARSDARREALRALFISAGLDEQQLAYVVKEALGELRAGYPAAPGRLPSNDILTLLTQAPALPAAAVPDLVDAFKLAHRPEKQSWWDEMAPFTEEQATILTLLGKTRSSAGASALANLIPRITERNPAWQMVVSLDNVASALIASGDAALPLLEWQIQHRSGVEQAYFEVVLARLDTPAAKDALKRHAARVGPALLASLGDARDRDLDVPRLLHSKYLPVNTSKAGLAIMRVSNLKLDAGPAAIDKLALALDESDPAVRLAASAALDRAPERELVRASLDRIAAAGSRPNAREKALIYRYPPPEPMPTCQ